MNRRKTLALLGSGLTFGGLYGVNSMTQSAIAANVSVSNTFIPENQTDEELQFNFDSFRLTTVNVDPDYDIQVILQGKIKGEESYEDIGTEQSIALEQRNYDNENISNQLDSVNLSDLNIMDELDKEGDEVTVKFKIILEHPDVDTITETSQTKISVTESDIEPSYPVLQSINTTSNNTTSDDNTIEISDWNDLDNVRNDLTGNYVLVNDLDSDTDGYAGIGDDWNPIGEQAFDGDFYEGIFDGDGFEIRDLIVDDTNRNVGLFSGIRGEIKNLSVVGDITTTSGSNGAGVLCAENRGLIENCIVEGSVTASSLRAVGGLAGREDGTITDSYSTASVVGDERVGGLVGRNEGTVTDSYATGSVEGDEEVGGLVGRNRSSIQTSYAVGPVTGNTNVGGLVGRNNDTVTDSYWDTESTGQSTSDGGTGLTTEKMQGSEAETNMDGFDFDDVWDTVG